MTKYARIEFRSHETQTRFPNEDDDWDRGDIHVNWTIPDVFRLTKERDYYSEPVSFEPQKGETYYMVYAIWSTGDSFGSYSQSDCESFGLYQTRKEAEDRVKELSAPREENKYRHPWDGYFESLDKIDIKEVIYAGEKENV